MFLLSFLSFHYRVYASVQSRKLCRNRQCVLQQRFHCFGAGLTKDKVSIDFQDIPEDSFESFQSAFKKEIVDSPLLKFNIMTDITMDIEIIPTTETKQPSHTTSFVLQPSQYSNRRSHQFSFAFHEN